MSVSYVQKNAILAGITLLTLVLSYQYFHGVQTRYLSVTSFTECVNAGFKVLITYPEKCVMPGKSFVNVIQKKEEESTKTTTKSNYKDESYILNGEQVSFINGKGYLLPNVLLNQGTTSLEIMDDPFLYDINGDDIKDTLFLLRTLGTSNEKSSYYISALVSLRDGFHGVNSLFVDRSLSGLSFLYRNGEIIVRYTIEGASTTQQQKYFTLEGGILRQITHK